MHRLETKFDVDSSKELLVEVGKYVICEFVDHNAYLLVVQQ